MVREVRPPLEVTVFQEAGPQLQATLFQHTIMVWEAMPPLDVTMCQKTTGEFVSTGHYGSGGKASAGGDYV